MIRIAKRYAKALFQLSKGDIPKAKRHLASLQTVETLFDHKDAGKILRSPVMPADLKRKLLELGLDAGQADADLKNLVLTLVEVGRENILPDITRSFSEMVDAAEQIVKGDVVAAADMPTADVDQIGSALGTLLKKKVVLRTHVDPAVLGGFVARVGNFLVDMSVKTRLEGLAQGAVQDVTR